VVDGERVAVQVGDGRQVGVAARAGGDKAEGILDMARRRQGVAAVAVLDQRVQDAVGGRVSAAAAVGVGIDEAAVPVEGQAAVGVRAEIGEVAGLPLVPVRAVEAALAVVDKGERNGQAAALGPADNGQGRGLVAVAGIDACN